MIDKTGRELAETHDAPSPDGKYTLQMDKWTSPNTFAVWEIRVYDATGKQIAESSRNIYSNSLISFLTQGGIDYLLISENYHGGYGVINLHTGEKAHYEPPHDPGNPYEQHFCWVSVFSHDPEAKQLKIYGCYWAAPFEIYTYDFSNPMSPPYPLLSREDAEIEEEDDDDDDAGS